MSQTASERPHLSPGDPAPELSLEGATGRRFTLSGQPGTRRTLLIFYPQDLTSG